MGWASDRIMWLHQRVSYPTIRDYTGIPESTAAYVVSGERNLPGQYYTPLANYFNKMAYAALKAAGATVSQARAYRGASVARINAFLEAGNTMIMQLAQSRFDQYKRYLIQEGRYISDADVLTRLAQSIAKNIGRSPRRNDSDFSNNSPSLRHFVVVDDEE